MKEQEVEEQQEAHTDKVEEEKQGDNEDLLDYLSRFKSERNVLTNLFGKGMLYGFAENTAEYIVLNPGDNQGKARANIGGGKNSL